MAIAPEGRDRVQRRAQILQSTPHEEATRRVGLRIENITNGPSPCARSGCDRQMRPWVEGHIAIDTDAVARWKGAELDLAQPLTTERICEAAQADPRIYEFAGPYFAMTALPSCVRPAEPLARVVYENGWRAPFATGPTRDELVRVLEEASQHLDHGD